MKTSETNAVEVDRATLHAITRFPDQLEAFYYSIPHGYAAWSPKSWDGIPSESFTAIEQICHVRDIEIDGYQVRFRRTLSETSPTLETIDGYELAKVRAYAQSKPADALAAFRAGRARTVETLSSLTASDLERPAVFDDYGALTLRSLVHYLCSHDQQHLAGLQWLLGQIETARGLSRSMR